MKKETIKSLLKQMKTKGKMTPEQSLIREELILESIEKASKQLLEHSKLIKDMIIRVEELEEMMKEKDEEISFIHRIFESS
jgi:hypothetical protein